MVRAASGVWNFLCAIFDEWVRKDVGRIFVQIFDVQLGIWLGLPSTLCVFGETCGNAVALEHNGDSIPATTTSIPATNSATSWNWACATCSTRPSSANSARQARHAAKYCRECDVKFACNVNAPSIASHNSRWRTRVELSLRGYKKFFHHIDPT